MLKFWYGIFGVSFFLVFFTMASAFFNPDLYASLTKEDGITEYLTAIFLLIGSLFLFSRMIKNRKGKTVYWFIFQLLMVFAFFFAFGEEISWGQRLLNIDSPEFFLENNAQEETNLHNLVVNGKKVNKIIFVGLLTVLIGIYFLFSQLLYRKVDRIKSLVDYLSFPIPKWISLVPFLILTLAIAFLDFHRQWEVWELAFAVTMLWIFVEPFNAKQHEF